MMHTMQQVMYGMQQLLYTTLSYHVTSLLNYCLAWMDLSVVQWMGGLTSGLVGGWLNLQAVWSVAWWLFGLTCGWVNLKAVLWVVELMGSQVGGLTCSS